MKKLSSCTNKEQEWVLNYLSTGKGTIPYEMITRYDSLDIRPDNGEFFPPHNFYSSLKDTTISDEEYENAKKIYQTIKLENLGELNKIFNFRDTIMLCEIFEQRRFTYRNYLNVSLENVILQVLLVVAFIGTKASIASIATPTDAEHVGIFEKTLIGGFSCVNTRLAFDTEILFGDNKN